MKQEPTITPLTPEQIKHWRDALFAVVGPYAYLATVEEIERYRAQMQRNLSSTTN